MAKTISTHNGSAVCRAHNKRDKRVVDKLEHIDPELSVNNLYLCDEAPRAAYARIFGDALADYNARQSRPERQIQDYYNHIQKDGKKHPVYEMIVQIGNKDDTGINAENEKQCLVEFYQGWAQRNPNLECIGAYIHADETGGTVHMHLDYVPVATGYARGLSIQSSLVKALEQQGFTKSGRRTAQIQWESRENRALEKICLEHGIEVVHPKRDNVKHLDTELYKAQQEAQRAAKTLETVQAKLDDTESRLASCAQPSELGKVTARRSLFGNNVVLSETDYDTLYDIAAHAKSHIENADWDMRREKEKSERLQEQVKEYERQYGSSLDHLRDRIEIEELQNKVETLTGQLQAAFEYISQLATALLHKLWQQCVQPLHRKDREIWSFDQAQTYAAQHDPATHKQLQAEQAHIKELEAQAGGPHRALHRVLLREYGHIPKDAEPTLQRLAEAEQQQLRQQRIRRGRER